MNEMLLFAGLIAGLIIGALLLIRAWLGRNFVAAAAGLLLLVGALAGTLIIFSWDLPASTRQAADIVEVGLALAAGPLVVILAAQLLRAPFSPSVAVGLAALAFISLVALDVRYGGDPIVYAIPVQVAFTLWAWLLFLRYRRAPATAARRSPAWKQQRLALWLLLAISISNIASLVRLALPDVDIVRPLVPLTLSAMFVILLLVILWSFLDRQTWAQGGRIGDREAKFVDLAAAAIVDERLFSLPDLKPDGVAARIGVPLSSLTNALAASEWGGFAALLQDLRLQQARLMLSDPAETQTSIEAIGLLCGFRSRSAFYEGFRRRYGVSPGAFRTKSNSLSGR